MIVIFFNLGYTVRIKTGLSPFPEGRQVSVLSQPKDCSVPDPEPVNIGPALFNLPTNQATMIDRQTDPAPHRDIFQSNPTLVSVSGPFTIQNIRLTFSIASRLLLPQFLSTRYPSLSLSPISPHSLPSLPPGRPRWSNKPSLPS